MKKLFILIIILIPLFLFGEESPKYSKIKDAVKQLYPRKDAPKKLSKKTKQLIARLIKQAGEYLEEQKYEEALKIYLKLQADYHENVTWNYFYFNYDTGYCCFKCKKYKQAIEYFNQSISRNCLRELCDFYIYKCLDYSKCG